MRNAVSASVLFILAFFWTLAIGIVGTWLVIDQLLPITTTAPPVRITNPREEITQEEYDIVIVTKEKPYKVVALEILRDNNGPKSAQAHYFDGEWHSARRPTYIITDKTDTSQLVSRVTFSTSTGYTETLGADTIAAHIESLYTPITIRTEKDYVKFGGATLQSGEYLTINGEPVESYAAMLKGYNKNTFNVDIEQHKVVTDWLMYWDKDWNFYHLDKTDVGVPHPKYESHEFFAKLINEGALGSVKYNFIDSVQNLESQVVVTDVEGSVLTLNEGPGYNRSGNEKFPAKIVTGENGGIGIYITVGK